MKYFFSNFSENDDTVSQLTKNIKYLNNCRNDNIILMYDTDDEAIQMATVIAKIHNSIRLEIISKENTQIIKLKSELYSNN